MELGRHALGGPCCGFRFRPGCRLWFLPFCQCRERILYHIFQGFDQEAYANTSGAFGNIGLVLTRPRCASNIEVHPGSIPNKFLEERTANNRASLTAVADIFNISKVTLNLLAVLLIQRQLPHTLGAILPSRA